MYQFEEGPVDTEALYNKNENRRGGEEEMFIKKHKSNQKDKSSSSSSSITTSISMVGIPQACLQTLLLVIITILVTVFHERERPGDMALISLKTRSVSAIITNKCHEGNLKDCLNGTTTSSQPYHKDQFEQKTEEDLNQRLFNVICIPFLILCSHVISTPFFIGYIRETSEDNSHNSNSIVQKNLKRISMLIMLLFACSFLFLQTSWHLPGNNLLLCEIWLISALFYISFHPASHYSEYMRHKYMPTRYLEFAFTLPLLAVASAATAGMTDIEEINWIFFTSLFMCLFLLCAEYHHHSVKVLNAEMDEVHMQATWVLILNALLCLIAFLVPASQTVEKVMANPYITQKKLEWAPTAFILLILLHVFYFLAVAGHRLWFHHHHVLMIWILDGISIIGRGTISLIIISGALDLQSE